MPVWYNTRENKKRTGKKMAKRRMLSLELMRSDEFLDLSAGSQLLYVHLTVEADDDGFLCGKKRILAMLGLPAAAFDALVSSGFIIAFPSGAAVITHWPLLNKVPKDRYVPTRFVEEKNRLQLVPGVGYALKTEEETESETVAAEKNPPKEPGSITGSAPVPLEPSANKSAAPEIDPDTVETLPVSGGSYPVKKAEAEAWRRLYPGVDVVSELRSMRGWLLAHPEKQKTADQIGRFVNYWLMNAQTRAREREQSFWNTGRSRYGPRIDEGPPGFDIDRAEQKMFTSVPKLKKKRG